MVPHIFYRRRHYSRHELSRLQADEAIQKKSLKSSYCLYVFSGLPRLLAQARNGGIDAPFVKNVSERHCERAIATRGNPEKIIQSSYFYSFFSGLPRSLDAHLAHEQKDAPSTENVG